MYSSIPISTRVTIDRTICNRSMRILRGLNDVCRHCEAGRLRRRRSCIRTTRFNKDPISASRTIGIRIESACKWRMTETRPALTASDPMPMMRRTPSRAAKNVHILCRRAKSKLDQAIVARAVPFRPVSEICSPDAVGCAGLDTTKTPFPRNKYALPLYKSGFVRWTRNWISRRPSLPAAQTSVSAGHKPRLRQS